MTDAITQNAKKNQNCGQLPDTIKTKHLLQKWITFVCICWQHTHAYGCASILTTRQYHVCSNAGILQQFQCYKSVIARSLRVL